MVQEKIAIEAELDAFLKAEKDKNSKILQEIMTIQAEHKSTLNKLAEAEDQCNEYKDQIYWLEGDK